MKSPTSALSWYTSARQTLWGEQATVKSGQCNDAHVQNHWGTSVLTVLALGEHEVRSACVPAGWLQLLKMKD